MVKVGHGGTLRRQASISHNGLKPPLKKSTVKHILIKCSKS